MEEQSPAADEEIASAAAAGDEAAFAELVSRHAPAVWRFAAGRLGDARDADEVTQDTFVRVHRSLRGWRGEASFRTWALSICRNLCTDRLRARRGRVVSLEEARARARPEPSAERGPDDRALDRISLERAVRGLSDEEREAFLLVDVLGLTGEEAARACDVPATTLRSRLGRARRKLVVALREG